VEVVDGLVIKSRGKKTVKEKGARERYEFIMKELEEIKKENRELR
jgi:hypothetical protein